MKVNREDEFGPVKNANGKDGEMVNDSPASARALLLAQHTRWAKNTCEKLGKAEHDDFEKEIDLLLTYEGEGDRLTAFCESDDWTKKYWK